MITEARITKGIRRAIKAGYITKVGRRYTMGDTRSEGFDMEEILPGEPMAMLPDGKPSTNLLTMREIRFIWRGQLTIIDAAKDLGVSEDRIAVTWDPVHGEQITVVEP
jgi:hypothetical protein